MGKKLKEKSGIKAYDSILPPETVVTEWIKDSFITENTQELC